MLHCSTIFSRWAVGNPSFCFSYLLWDQKRFQIEHRVKTRKRSGVLQKFFPIEMFYFSKILKIVAESSQFNWKYTEKLKNGTFFIQLRRYGVIISFLMIFWCHTANMSHFIKNVLYNIFQYEILDRMSYLRTLFENYENIRKIKFQ